MKRQSIKFFLFLIAVILIFPQVTFAAWWNPFSWGIWKSKPQTSQGTNVPVSQAPQQAGPAQQPAPTQSPISPTLGPTISDSALKKIALGGAPIITTTKLSNAQIIAKIKPSVAYIETSDGSGSGMVFSADGYILTNAHVVKGFNNVTAILQSGKSYSATVVGRDEGADLAVLRVSGNNMPAVQLGNSDKLNQGDEIFTFGFPFGIKGDVAFKDGTVSRKVQGGNSSYIEISAEIHPGNSGGPLVDKYGQVVGVNSAALGKTIGGIQVGETIKFAIPINVAKGLIASLKSGRNIVVETAEEKAAKTRTANEPKCKTESESYYNEVVAKINNDMGIGNPDTQAILRKIDLSEAGLKQDRDKQVADITAKSDDLISQTKLSSQRYINSLRNSALVAGRDPDIASADAVAKLEKDIAYLESQKLGSMGYVNMLYEESYRKNEALRTKIISDTKKRVDEMMVWAGEQKQKYHETCLNK